MMIFAPRRTPVPPPEQKGGGAAPPPRNSESARPLSANHSSAAPPRREPLTGSSTPYTHTAPPPSATSLRRVPERPFEQKSLAPRGRRGARLDLAVSANRGAGHGRAGDPRNAGGRRDAAARGRAGARHHCAAPALAGAKRAPVAAGCPLFSEGGPPARRGAPLWIAGAARAVESWTEQQKRAQTMKRPSSDGWCVVGVCRRDPVGPRRGVCGRRERGGRPRL